MICLDMIFCDIYCRLRYLGTRIIKKIQENYLGKKVFFSNDQYTVGIKWAYSQNKKNSNDCLYPGKLFKIPNMSLSIASEISNESQSSFSLKIKIKKIIRKMEIKSLKL